MWLKFVHRFLVYLHYCSSILFCFYFTFWCVTADHRDQQSSGAVPRPADPHRHGARLSWVAGEDPQAAPYLCGRLQAHQSAVASADTQVSQLFLDETRKIAVYHSIHSLYKFYKLEWEMCSVAYLPHSTAPLEPNKFMYWEPNHVIHLIKFREDLNILAVSSDV